MLSQNSRELTDKYRRKTLPDGWYYFNCGGTSPQIGKYVNPTPAEICYALANGLDRPQPKLHTFPGLFIGALESIRILAPVPDYEEIGEMN